jgi:HlyD family secretion protein
MKRLAIILVGLALVGSIAGAVWLWPHGNGKVVRLPGTVEIQEVRLGSKVGGRVAAVLVHEGDVVPAGTLLVRFDVPELLAQRNAARQRLAATEADLQKALRGPRDEEIAEAKALADAARAKFEMMKTGFREEEKRQAKSELEAAQADLRQAEEEFTRESQLRGTPGSSQTAYDAAVANRDRARGRTRAAQARWDWMQRGNRPEEIAAAKAELDRCEAHYALLRNGTREEDKALAAAQVAEARAKLAEIEANLAEADVRAPERCVIEVLGVRPGDLVPAGQPVVRALRADDLWVKVFVPATELGKVRLGQEVEVTVDSHPGHRFPGTVIQVASISEFTPRNVQSLDERRHQVFAVKVRVADPNGVFKSGMAAEVYLPLHEEP